MDLSAIPLLDHHCHALRRPATPLDGSAFRSHFSESSDPDMAGHIASSLFYRRGLRDLAEALECAPIEEAILAVRNGEPLTHYAHRLLEKANISTLLVDTGFRGVENYSLEEMGAFLPCTVQEVLRLETVMEQLVLEKKSLTDLEEAFRVRLSDARAQGILAFKSIAAYRGGLQVERRTRQEALGSFDMLRETAVREGRLRLSDRPLLEYLLRIALEEAARQELPVQFHTGFGDSDADLRTANPLHLRALLEDPSLRKVRFVLLHTYPYVREAGYLASIYGHVYTDLSLTIPFTAHGGAGAILQALELAPTSKVLLSTDAFSIPELYYLGAHYARKGLGEALENLCDRDWLHPNDVEETAHMLLHRNAQALYGIDDALHKGIHGLFHEQEHQNG